jgi:DNA-binding transcriptional regulator YhcF (GntR family)
MDIRISKESEVPIRQQLAEQIVLLIATEKLRPGEALPSVRELARRLKIHHNTVSEAYQELVRRNWLTRRRGSHLVVRSSQAVPAKARELDLDLDDLINAAVELARERGYSLQALRKRVRERLMTQPVDHLLMVEEEPGLCRVLQEEIHAALGCAVEGCSRQELARNPGLLIGALVVTPQYALGDVTPLVPKDRPPIPVTFCIADEYVEKIRKLQQPSVIALVSVSLALLNTAHSVFAPAAGRRHTLVEYLLPLENSAVLRAADLVFCDSIARQTLKSRHCIHCRLVEPASLKYLASATKAVPKG